MTKGHPFHGHCDAAECARDKGVRFCGECAFFPCEILNGYAFDPVHGDKGKRIENCKQMKAALVAEARVGLDPVSVCGHHCDHCFLGKWCGGCRSGYNCCSFATISEGGVCPQVSCAREKSLDGCYDCPELEDCRKGYYGVENEYICKATALFVRLHGKEALGKALARAIREGEDYPKSFDASGSTQAALALLEKYL